MFENINFAVISGICASAGSVFGKLSGLPNYQGNYFLRFLFFTLMLSCNTACMTFFVKSLQQNLSLKATLISSSTNYIVTAIAGFVIFEEATTLLWWSGIILIILGLILIVSEEYEDNRIKQN